MSNVVIKVQITNNGVFSEDSVSHKTYSYTDLWTFKAYLSQRLKELDRATDEVIVLQSGHPLELSLTIAALFLHEQAFCVVDPHLTATDVQRLAKKYQLGMIWDEYAISEEITQAFHQPFATQEGSSSVSLGYKSEVFGYLFTSGSTGEPSLIPLRYSQLKAATENSHQFIALGRAPMWGLPLGFHHIGGLSALLKSLISGGAVSLSQGANYELWNRWISEDTSCRIISMVPTQLHKWLHHNSTNDITITPTQHFGYILLGGGPSNPLDVQKAKDLGWPVMLSYGMTETFAHISKVEADRLDLSLYMDVSNSIPVGHLDSQHSLAMRFDGQEHIIWLKGPQIMGPDARCPELVNRFDEQGWFCTGDIGELDLQGRLIIHARRSDRIVSGGENVSPIRVQQTLLKHPSIFDAHILGIPDQNWGQKVVAILQLSDEQQDIVSADSKHLHSVIIDYCKNELPPSHVPKKIHFVSSIPRTTLGKIKWVELQKILDSR